MFPLDVFIRLSGKKYSNRYHIELSAAAASSRRSFFRYTLLDLTIIHMHHQHQDSRVLFTSNFKSLLMALQYFSPLWFVPKMTQESTDLVSSRAGAYYYVFTIPIHLTACPCRLATTQVFSNLSGDA